MAPTQIIKDKKQINEIIRRLVAVHIRPKQLELNLTSDYKDID